jgi:two-component system, NtrC family, response regulator AtoC
MPPGQAVPGALAVSRVPPSFGLVSAIGSIGNTRACLGEIGSGAARDPGELGTMAANNIVGGFVPDKASGGPSPHVVFGQSEIMRSVRQKIEKVAGTNVPVLIQGESGTGKEVLARLIHHLSPRAEGPFVKVNCAAIPGTLLESELFGYRKGAFTGAYNTKPGRVEMADGGTLFLDEIGELDSSLQAKLLQVLQDGQFTAIGDQEEKRIDTRVICATNRRLEDEIEAGRFRADLFYRINVISVHLPRLRDRREDIPGLVEYFLAQFNARFQRSAPLPSRELLQMFQDSDWPGNIRELENRVARYVILGSEEAFRTETAPPRPVSLPFEITENGTIPLKRIAKQAVREMERELILKVLQANHWNRRKAAQQLAISYRALIYKIREAGLSQRHNRKETILPPNTDSAAAAGD